MPEKDAIINVQNLKKYFPVKGGFFSTLVSKKESFIRAVDNVSFDITRKEIIGLAGESGSGKTTTGEIIAQLQDPTEGDIIYNQKNLKEMKGKELVEFRRSCQMVFQDPYETLNPRFTVRRSVEEPLLINGWRNEEERYNKVKDALERAGLQPAVEYMYRFPHELSGGQRQRVAIARGIVLDPILLVADEPVSMLDVSIRAGILNLLRKLREDMGLSMLYISHDLSTMKYICDQVIIMYLGRIVEMGSTNIIFGEPFHPYTQALLASVPLSDPDVKREEARIKGELPDQINLPRGCRFAPRCTSAMVRCQNEDPQLIPVGEEHKVACFLYNSS